MKKTVLCFLIAGLACALMTKAYGLVDDDPWIFTYDDDGNLQDIFALGDNVNITAYCGGWWLPFNITITAPNSSIVYTQTGINTNWWSVKFSNMTDALGWWLVELIGKGGVRYVKGWASGTYFVIPQAPLGVIATLSACLAGLGLTKIRRRKT